MFVLIFKNLFSGLCTVKLLIIFNTVPENLIHPKNVTYKVPVLTEEAYPSINLLVVEFGK